MTWAEFKRKVEAGGVRDRHIVRYIDVETDADDETVYLTVRTEGREGEVFFTVEG